MQKGPTPLASAALRWPVGLALVYLCPAWAHHSFAMFDQAKEETLSGTVKNMDWVNPHIWIDLTVPDASGEYTWNIEGASPLVLARSGFNKNSLTPGMKVSITFHPFKNGERGGSLIAVTLPDGRVLSGSPK